MRKGLRHIRRLTSRQLEERVKCLAAINRVRRGDSKTLSAAARAEHTSVRTIRRVVPAAILAGRRGGRIRVKAADPYTAPVEILTESGTAIVSARGSRNRELAGQHRATWLKVLHGKEPPSALKKYRGMKIGGRKLLSDYDQLISFAKAGIMGQLDTLYVSPDTSV